VKAPQFRFTGEVVVTGGDVPWWFCVLPFDEADAIDEVAGPVKRGFGSVRVEATTGSTTWRTSLFPDARRRTFVLPLKRAVREAEGIEHGRPTTVVVRLVDLADRTVPDDERDLRDDDPAGT
jgi:hypothetical protein